MLSSPSFTLTLAFAIALVVGLGLKFWLATRQIRHVAQHRGAVPQAFSARISLVAHQKAADYTLAKSRLGLIDKVKVSTITEEQAQAQLIEFLSHYVGKGKAPLCGNSIGQDRRFLVKYMPQLDAFFHYRNIDVSTLKELAKRWRPDVYKSFKKQDRKSVV